MFTNDFLPVKLLAKVLIRKTINVLHFRWSRYSMNRHEDDESTGHSSQSSRHSSRLFKYDDITILIEALTGQLYELKCSPTENILSIKGESAL